MKVIEEIRSDHMLKGVGEPEYYLGGNVNPLDDTWKPENVSLALSARTYIKNVVERFECLFTTDLRLYKTQMSDEYHPETDDTPLLDARGGSLYRSLLAVPTGPSHLAVFDIQYATQTLSQYSMAPREGHLHAMKRVLGYLKKFPKGKIMVDSSY